LPKSQFECNKVQYFDFVGLNHGLLPARIVPAALSKQNWIGRSLMTAWISPAVVSGELNVFLIALAAIRKPEGSPNEFSNKQAESFTEI
jgi:hypothetical protein